jgi:2-C-methyl-D-erythritol 4-phosphate cytidylyltransferase/2-C-methyl-D-erythritol 2,4-cyclodiphosphate synthase
MAEEHARTGFGFDAHRFAGVPPILLCGVTVDDERGVEATSDGDVAAHAIIDAMFGAAAIGDLGTHFPPDDPAMRGADSMSLLGRALRLVEEAGFQLGNVDVTIISQSVRVAPHAEAMRAALAGVLGLDVSAISVKATTTDGMGSIGADEGIASAAVATIR